MPIEEERRQFHTIIMMYMASSAVVIAFSLDAIQINAVTLNTGPYVVIDPLQQVLSSQGGDESLIRYPTDLTRDLMPVREAFDTKILPGVKRLRLKTSQKYLHSHNDYWRDIPFYSGMRYLELV